MTRGTLVMFQDGKIYRSVEFNGDMYPSGYGAEAFTLMQEVVSLKYFKVAATAMNAHFHYEGGNDVSLIADRSKSPDLYDWFCDMTTDYFFSQPEDDFSTIKWFSDYLYIRNAGIKDVVLKTVGNIAYTLEPGQTVCLYFGKLLEPGEQQELEDLVAKFKQPSEVFCTSTAEAAFAALEEFLDRCPDDGSVNKKRLYDRMHSLRKAMLGFAEKAKKPAQSEPKEKIHAEVSK